MNILKNISKSVIFAVMVMGLFIATSSVRAEEAAPVTGGANAEVVVGPSAQGSNTNDASATIIPATGGSSTNDASATIIPSTGGSNTNDASGTIIPNTGNGSSSGTPTPGGDNGSGSNPGDGSNGGGNGSGDGSSGLPGGSTGSSGSSVLLSSTGNGLTVVLPAGGCNYLSDYLKFGRDNSIAEVTKLQLFLKNNENIDVDVNGRFDDKTLEAVKTFQAKYLTEVMGPWGANIPSGQVWYTTKKKVNELYCKSIVNLTPQQLAEIEAYRNGLIANNTVGTSTTTPNGTSATSTQDIGSNTNDNGPLTAASVNVPFTTKIWNFIKWLFGY